jgi:hypothetical protein
MMRAVTISVAVIAAVAVLSGAVVGQQSGSGSAVVSTGISASTSVEPRSADFDADGDPEIAVASGSGEIIIHDPLADTTDRQRVSGSVKEMDIGDFDNDGELEILFDDDETRLQLFDPVDGAVLNTPEFSPGNTPGFATVGDVLGDGGDDFVRARGAGFEYSVHDIDNTPTDPAKFPSSQARVYAGGTINTVPNRTVAVRRVSNGNADIEIIDVGTDNSSFATVEDVPEEPSVTRRGQYAIGNVTSGVNGAEVLYVNQSDLIAEAAAGSTTTIATNVDIDGVFGVADVGTQTDAAVFARNGQLSYKSVGGREVNTGVSVTGTGVGVGDFRGDADDDIAFIDGAGELAIYSEPEKLEIRNASSPNSLVTNATVDVRFFTDTGTVTTQQTSTGIIDLTNSPPNAPLLVRVDAVGFNSRELILPSLIRQQEVFLVPTSQSTIDVEFSLEDNTGRFPGPETDLILERPLNVSGQTTFTRIEAGDFGASGTKSVTLVPGQRYRVTVKNGDRTRELGPVTPTRPQVIPLEVGKLEFGVENESTFGFNATRNADTLTAVYEDPDAGTTRMTISFREINNESNVVATSTKTSTTGTFKFSHQLQGDARNDSYVARFEGARDGEQLNQTVVIGADRFPLGTGLDEGWQQIFSVGLILVVGGLFSAGNARIGAIVVPAIGGILFYLGWLSGVAGASTVVLALALGAGYNLVTTRGVPT